MPAQTARQGPASAGASRSCVDRAVRQGRRQAPQQRGAPARAPVDPRWRRQRGGFGRNAAYTVTRRRAPHARRREVLSRIGAPLRPRPRVRTIFLQFESADWEQELTAFYNTDVEVPATMIVDGKTYRDVGVHFRGNSSFRMVPDRLQALAEPHTRLRPRQTGPRRVQQPQPPQREQRPDVPAHHAVRRDCAALSAHRQE